jgi:hypothetical protein
MPDIGLQLTKLKEAYTPQLQRLVYVENGRRLLAEKGVAA